MPQFHFAHDHNENDSGLCPCIFRIGGPKQKLPVIETMGASPQDALKLWGGSLNTSDLPKLDIDDEPKHLTLLAENDIPFIADMHCHFFPETLFRLIWRWFDAVGWPTVYAGNEESRLAALKRNRIKYYTTLLYAHKPDMAASLNSWVADNIHRWPGAIGFGTFFPEDRCLAYTQKAVEEYGLRGFKLHCEVSALNLRDSHMTDTFKYLARVGIPVLIHSGHTPIPGPFTGFDNFYQFKSDHPDLKVIVAHMGASEVDRYAQALTDLPNYYLDTTMIFTDFNLTGQEQSNWYELLEKYNSRIFFGTDFPNIPYNINHPVIKILEHKTISKQTKQRLFYRNMMELLGITETA